MHAVYLNLKAAMDAVLPQMRTAALPHNGQRNFTAGRTSRDAVISLVYITALGQLVSRYAHRCEVAWPAELSHENRRLSQLALAVNPNLRNDLVLAANAYDQRHPATPCLMQVAWYLFSNGQQWPTWAEAQGWVMREAGPAVVHCSAVLQRIEHILDHRSRHAPARAARMHPQYA